MMDESRKPTLEEAMKMSWRKLHKTLKISEHKARTLKSAFNPDKFFVLVNEKKSLDQMAKELKTSKRYIASLRSALISTGYTERKKRIQSPKIERGKLSMAVYRELERHPLMTTIDLYNAIKPPITIGTFRKKVSHIIRESIGNPSLDEIRRLDLRGRSKGATKRYHAVYDGLPHVPFLYLEKNVDKVAEVLVEKCDPFAIAQTFSVQTSLKRAIYKMKLIKLKSQSYVSQIYSLLRESNIPLRPIEISEKMKIGYITVITTLRYLEEKGLVKRIKGGYGVALP